MIILKCFSDTAFLALKKNLESFGRVVFPFSFFFDFF